MSFIAHSYIYIHLYIVHWHQRMPARYPMLPARYYMLLVPHKYHVCPLSYNFCRYLFLWVYLVFYVWYHTCKQMSYELWLLFTIYPFLQIFYNVQVFTAHWLRTVRQSWLLKLPSVFVFRKEWAYFTIGHWFYNTYVRAKLRRIICARKTNTYHETYCESRARRLYS